MIAVLADEGEYPAAREFFELFKTPWEFYRGDSSCSVLLCTANCVPDNSAKVVFVYGSRENGFDRAAGIRIGSRHSGAMLARGNDRIPVYGNCLTFETAGRSILTLESSPATAAIAFALGGRRIIRIGFDLFQEVRHLLTRGQPASHAAIPALDLHIALMRDLIVECCVPLIEIPPVPDGYSCIACLTHDMDHIGVRNHKFDHTMFGFLYRAGLGSVLDAFRGKKTLRQLGANWLAILKLPLVHLGLARDFWAQFDRYLEIEGGLPSTWFFIPKKGETGLDKGGNRPTRRAANYDAAGHVSLIQMLQAAGKEIGLHGIDAWRDSVAGAQEGEIISRLTGVAETGVRMHWLYFDEGSPTILEAAGFTYDSTFGYNQTVGYRAGTAQVFKPETTERLLELPMHVMDTALFYRNYLDLAPAQAQEKVQTLVAAAARAGGVLTVNWHDRSVSPERLWDATYLRTIEQLRASDACFLTAGAAVSWFRRRRAVTFERNGGAVKIKIPAAADTGLPGLRVRNYKKDKKISETSLTHDSEVLLDT